MRRIVVAVMSTISALVLLFSYHTSTGQSSAAGALGGGLGLGTGTGLGTGSGAAKSSGGSGSGAGTGGNGSAASGSGSGTGSGSSGQTGSTGGSSSVSGTVTGDSADTRWGPVQVQITVQGGKIVSANAVVVPNGNFRDQEINAYAVPILNQQAVQVQSANIDGVSGATVTSGGYQQSLQSAINKAHLG
jgi:uncharacterized protein with FMN-binding domain